MFLFVFIGPIVITFILWNLFRLHRPIDVQIINDAEESELNIIN